jgi:hypothetical protein
MSWGRRELQVKNDVFGQICVQFGVAAMLLATIWADCAGKLFKMWQIVFAIALF